MSWFNEAAHECQWPCLWKLLVVICCAVLTLLVVYAL